MPRPCATHPGSLLIHPPRSCTILERAPDQDFPIHPRSRVILARVFKPFTDQLGPLSTRLPFTRHPGPPPTIPDFSRHFHSIESNTYTSNPKFILYNP